MEAEYYDEGWDKDWSDMNKYGPLSRHLRRIVVSELEKISFKSLLDVGCGQGSLLSELQLVYPKVIFHGIDFSTSAIKLAKGRIHNCNFYVMDISTESLNRKFDVVICSEVLEHIENDEAAIQNLYYMTGKYLIVSSPQGRMRNFEESVVGHVRNYAKGELVTKLEATGLEPINVIEWGFPFYSPLYRNYLEITRARGTGGRFGLGKKIISKLLYALFLLNSPKHGDELIILSQPAK